MPNIFPLLNRWSSSPAMSEYIDIEKFIDGGVFRTKSGQIGVILSVQGIDYESVLGVELDTYTAQLERAFQMFDLGTRVYQYFFRSTNPAIPHRDYGTDATSTIIGLRMKDLQAQGDNLFETRVMLAILVDMASDDAAASKVSGLLSSLSAKKIISYSLEAQGAARVKLMQQVDTFIAAVDVFADVAVLDEAGAYELYRMLLNPSPVIRQLGMVDGVADAPAYFAADSSLRVNETYLELDDYFVKVLTLKALPFRTSPNLLKALFLVPGTYHVVSTWVAESHETTRKHSESIIEHNDATKSKGTLTPKRQTLPGRENKAKNAISDLLADSQVDIALKGLHFGHYSLTVVVYDRDPELLENTVNQFITAAQQIGVSVLKETEFANLAFLATFPGAHRYNLRAKRISEANNADLSFFYTLDTGSRVNNHLKDEYCAVFTTRNSEPYYYNFHCGEVGHTAILGPTSMGKSFLMNFLIGQVSKYKPFVTVIDLGGSYKFVTKLLGGTYTNFSNTSREFRLNPFRLPHTKGNLDFLTTLVCSLIEHSTFQMSDKQKDEVYQKIDQLYAIDNPAVRRLSTLANMLPESLSDRLTRWVGEGQYAYIFDNPDGEDSLAMARFQTFNFEGFDEKSDFLQPLIFYLFHVTSAHVTDPDLSHVFKLFVIDEAVQFFKYPAIVAYLNTALLTWRKNNAAAVFATQSIENLAKTGILEDVVNSCRTKILLSNPKVDADMYARTFKMDLATAELVRGLTPRREVLLLTDKEHKDRSGNTRFTPVAKVLRLDVSPRERWLYSNSAPENNKRNAALRMFDNDLNRALDYLVEHPSDEPAVTA